MSQDQVLDELKEQNNELRLEVQQLKLQAEMAKLMAQLDNRNKELENKNRELQHRDNQLDVLKQLFLQKYESEATGSGGIAGNVLTRPTQPSNPKRDPKPEEKRDGPSQVRRKDSGQEVIDIDDLSEDEAQFHGRDNPAAGPMTMLSRGVKRPRSPSPDIPISSAAIQSRLRRLPTLNLPKNPFYNRTLSRVEIHAILKGVLSQSNDMKCNNSKKIHVDALQTTLCVTSVPPKYNPYAPRVPGAPGLMFALRGWRDQEARSLLIACVKHCAAGGHPGSSTNQYNIMGNYQIRREEDLTAREFSELPEDVKTEFVEIVTSQTRGRTALVAICLRRKLRREPTDGEISYECQTFKLHRARAERRLSEVTNADVLGAFSSGQEKIRVWSMECVGYDGDIKRVIMDEAEK